MPKSKEQQEVRNKFQDTDLELVQRALETETVIILHPRRSHTIKGVPVEFDVSTLRVFIKTGKNIESVLLSEIGHFIFPVELWNLKIKSNDEEIAESATDYMKRKEAEKERLTKECKNCDKKIPKDLVFCSAKCMKEYKRNNPK